MKDISVIIAAAGLGKRLYSESLEVPKPLFYYKNKPIIAHLIDQYKEISNNIIVVIGNNKPGNLLKAWLLDYYKDPNWLKIIIQIEPSGTNDVVIRAKEFVNGKCLISWSDFIIEDNTFIDKIKNTEKDLFFTSNINCRFGYTDRIIKKDSNPGFIGIYYFDKLPEINIENEDFIENFLDKKVNIANVNVINLGNISEISQNNGFSKSSNRYFNTINFIEDKVYKTAITNHAKILQEKEIAWYKKSSLELQKYLPKFEVNKNQLILEKINGKPISQCQLDEEFWRKKLPEALMAMHQGKFETNKKSCIDTYINKPIQRLKEVDKIINEWFSDSWKINGEDYKNWAFPNHPKDLIPNHFTFIHGDLQFSNSMLDEEGNIKIIDPRGYFGETLLYGDPAYDIAKILYAVDAYHKINEGKFGIHKTNNGTWLIHQSYELNEDIRWFFNWACERYEISREKLNFILFGIWLSLTSYIIDNPLAIIASYCKAMIRSRHFILGK